MSNSVLMIVDLLTLALAIFVAAIIALTFRKGDFSGLSASACYCEVDPIRKRLLVSNLICLALALGATVTVVASTSII